MVESKFQTSFIPKKPIESSDSRPRRQPAGLSRLIAILILLVALLTWGGLFLWKLFLQSKINSDKDSIVKSQQEFEQGTVTTLVRLDSRLNAATTLVNNHQALSKLFALLENVTLKNVQFSNFSLVYNGADKGINLTMNGQATTYAAVAKQSDAFSQSRQFKSPIFSNLNLDQTGKVTFSVSTTLDPRDFAYGGVAAAGQ